MVHGNSLRFAFEHIASVCVVVYAVKSLVASGVAQHTPAA